ncbi:MAG: phosphopantetheine-binding protein, partial [Candidatus Acidiferrum sp.]
YVAPCDALEQYLCEAWAAVLALDKVGIRDNFFDLGGHSLLAVRIASMVRSDLGVDLRVAMLFDHPTIEALALALEENALQSMSEQELINLHKANVSQSLSTNTLRVGGSNFAHPAF